MTDEHEARPRRAEGDGPAAGDASVLVRAPPLPVDLPAFRMRLVDVRVARRSVELLVGRESPVAALRLSSRRASLGDVVALGRGRAAAVDVTVTHLHASAEAHREALDAMASRLRAAVTEAQWARSSELAARLREMPVGVPLEYYRQVVWGTVARGLVRVGFGGNQDCGICWQDRDWGRFSPSRVLRWIEDLRAAVARRLIISGGEPMLDASLDGDIRRAVELGFEEVSLETNAVKGVHALLDARVPVKFNAVRAACFGVRTHDVSLYGERCAEPITA